MAETNLISSKDRADFIEGVHSGRYGPGVIPPAIYLKTGEILMDEVMKGFGRSFFDDTIAKGDLDWLESAHKNIYLFSGAKTQRQALDLQKAAVDSDGFLKPFSEYKKTALEIDRAYNLNWLRTEMTTAFSLSQSASNWKDIERVKEVFTHLKYITKEDNNVRQSHRPLNAIIRPVDDPFWDTHFPPVDWNCRCTFEQLMANEVPKRVGRIDKTVRETPSPLFRINPGKTGTLFTKAHPYFEDVLAKYPYLERIVPPTPPPPPTQRVIPDPPKQQVPGPPMSPQLYKTIKEELGDEFKDFDQRVIQLASKEKQKGRLSISFTDAEGNGSYYMPFTQSVVIAKKGASGRLLKRWSKSQRYRKRVIYHELGHSIHTELDIIDAFSTRSDWRDMFVKHEKSISNRTKQGKVLRSEINKKLNDILRVVYHPKATSTSFRDQLKQVGHGDLVKVLSANDTLEDVQDMLTCTADSMGSLTRGAIGWGHAKKYYRQINGGHKEHFAHAMENYFQGNPAFKYIAPDMYQETKDFIEKILKENDIPT